MPVTNQSDRMRDAIMKGLHELQAEIVAKATRQEDATDDAKLFFGVGRLVADGRIVDARIALQLRRLPELALVKAGVVDTDSPTPPFRIVGGREAGAV